jgi:uncharacterized protein YqcC (DUF446 family)
MRFRVIYANHPGDKRSRDLLKSMYQGWTAGMPSANLRQDALEYVNRIEAEMRRIGWWQNTPLRPEQLQFKEAFAMDTMTFAQWLQFIFLPRVREAATTNNFPSGSSVGAQAVREFDGVPEADPLVTLLSEFDALFD